MIKLKFFFLIIIFVFGFYSQASMPETAENIENYRSSILVNLEELNSIHFTAHPRFRIQTRMTVDDFDSKAVDKDAIDFAVRRARLRLDGTVLRPELQYRLQLSFSRGDMDFDNTQYPNILRDAAVAWSFSEDQILWFGQTKLPGNRQRVISSGNQELVDRSIINATFNIDRDMGVQYFHRLNKERPLWIKVAISNGEGRSVANRDQGLSYTTRIEWLPLGDFTNGGDYFEGDLEHEDSPKLMLGYVYNDNKQTRKTGGQIGETFDAGISRDLNTQFIDITYKYKGWSVTSEWAKRNVKNPFVTVSGNIRSIYKGQGAMAQVSYIFANGLSPVLRIAELQPEREIAETESRVRQSTLGLTKYLNSHKVKILGDVTFENRSARETVSALDHWQYRFQVEVGI